jgi:ribose transport system permease protein
MQTTYKRTNFFVFIGQKIAGFFKRNYGPLLALFVLCAILSIATTTLLKPLNIMNVLRQISTNALLAAGITCVLITGNIDLSIGSTVAVAGVVAIVLNTMMGLSVIVSVLIAIAIGAAAGFLNGIIRAKTMLPPFIITLATQQSLRGMAYIFTNGYPVQSQNKSFDSIGSGYIGPIPVPIIIMVVMLIIVGVILSRTKLGRHMYAVGGNMDAARHSGISYTKIVVFAYVVAGSLAALSGVITAARMTSGQPTVGVEYGTDAIAAAVIGGTAFGGGFGTMAGTLIGAMIIGVISNGLNLIGVNFFYQLIVKGLIILFAVWFDSAKGNIFKDRRKKKVAAAD